MIEFEWFWRTDSMQLYALPPGKRRRKPCPVPWQSPTRAPRPSKGRSQALPASEKRLRQGMKGAPGGTWMIWMEDCGNCVSYCELRWVLCKAKPCKTRFPDIGWVMMGICRNSLLRGLRAMPFWCILQVFMGKNYLENFVQSTFDALKATGVPVEGGTIVIGGDGRYFNKDCCQQLQHLRFSWRWSLVVQEGLMVVQSLAELLSL